MTTTLDRPQLTADDIAMRWLQDFESALSRRDIPAAAGLFATDSYWRDLVSFTWNLKTVENPDGVTDLLTHNLDRVSPEEFELSQRRGAVSPKARMRSAAWRESTRSAPDAAASCGA